MHRFFISLSLGFILWQAVHAQNDSLPTQRIQKTNIGYQSFATADDKLFAVNDSGQLVIWDLNKLDTIHFAYHNSLIRYTAVSRDTQNQIFVGTNKGSVYKINPADLSCSLFLQSKYAIHSICFNAANKMLLIVPYAVYDPLSKKSWTRFTHQKNGMIFKRNGKVTNQYFDLPQITFTDGQDRIWMASSFGEFGGSLQLFDSKNEKILNDEFDKLDMGLLFPKSIFSDDEGNIYVTSGLQHFMNFGEIYKINLKREVSKIYDSKEYRDTIRNKADDNGIFMGPGAYRKTDHSIYFATDKGFFKAGLSLTGKLLTPKLLFHPALSWRNEPLAIGVGMTVKQVEFTAHDKLLFMTSNDGFGIYDGQSLTFLK